VKGEDLVGLLGLACVALVTWLMVGSCDPLVPGDRVLVKKPGSDAWLKCRLVKHVWLQRVLGPDKLAAPTVFYTVRPDDVGYHITVDRSKIRRDK
jgi:hypothetical protein